MDNAMTLTSFLLARISEDEADSWIMSEGGGRTRDEAEAKRRIVEECAAEVVARPVSPRAKWLAGYTMMQLALPYADHPDYRPEWRP